MLAADRSDADDDVGTAEFDEMAEAWIAAGRLVERYGSAKLKAAMKAGLTALAFEMAERIKRREADGEVAILN